MTGQEELEHIRELKKKVEEQIYFIEQLRSALDGLSGITYDKDKVQTSMQDDPMLEKICRIEEEEQKLQRMKQEWISWKIKMIRKIHRMKISNLQKLLYLVYIGEYSLAESAKIMCWSYDYTKKQHSQALKEFDTLDPLHIP